MKITSINILTSRTHNIAFSSKTNAVTSHGTFPTSSSFRFGQISCQDPESIMISDVMHLLKNSIGIDVTIGSPSGAIERSGFGFGARVPSVTVIILAQRVLGMMQRTMEKSIRHHRKYVGRRHGYRSLDTGGKWYKLFQLQCILIRRCLRLLVALEKSTLL